MRRLSLVLLLLLVFAPTVAQDELELPEGEIVFVSRRDGNNEIYIMNADGSNQRNLTNNPARDGEPVWSPDGEKIAFVSNRDEGARGTFVEGANIFIMNADGSDVYRLTSGIAYERFPAFSPDGQTVAFSSYRDTNDDGELENGLFISDLSGHRLEFFAEMPDGWVNPPAWSPDGKYIALFIPQYPHTNHNLVVVDIETRENHIFSEEFTSTEIQWLSSSRFTFANCGSWIVETTDWQLTQLDIASVLAVEITGACISRLIWSPDRDYVGLRIDWSEHFQEGVYIFNVADGRDFYQIPDEGLPFFEFSPDSNIFMYLENPTRSSHDDVLVLVDVASGEILVRIEEVLQEYPLFPSWRPQPTENN